MTDVEFSRNEANDAKEGSKQNLRPPNPRDGFIEAMGGKQPDNRKGEGTEGSRDE